jgi:hypothetical protein
LFTSTARSGEYCLHLRYLLQFRLGKRTPKNRIRRVLKVLNDGFVVHDKFVVHDRSFVHDIFVFGIGKRSPQYLKVLIDVFKIGKRRLESRRLSHDIVEIGKSRDIGKRREIRKRRRIFLKVLHNIFILEIRHFDCVATNTTTSTHYATSTISFLSFFVP